VESSLQKTDKEDHQGNGRRGVPQDHPESGYHPPMKTTDEKPMPPDSYRIEDVRLALAELTDEGRLDAIAGFCHECGRMKLPCHCWNDE
jgi:hypothetical protein